ncbi:hypothetical protein [Leptospira biflexa]|uniref:hypothetical protein n=1 Tax=Leptospira biflexa TaxID=172 RepID=UPI0010837F48|nr:hypothetical protein [Leptospira biflexa]TGM33716.1 hypothetical protein EHQ80_15845 [Leptospira biflexa]TGM35418.1 hypothetical protein EHQ89_10880 [Leptospira biflexa]TGM57306.1 hypothetical protein EHQ91_00160 [Leptospira biflexa]
MDIQSLYEGKTTFGKLSKESKSYLYPIHKYIQDEFPKGNPSIVTSQIPYLQLQNSMFQIRNRIYQDQSIPKFLYPILEEWNVDLNDVYVDLLRLRCVPNGFHNLEGTESVQFLHRDPWYANPENQINIWIPITKVELGSGFSLYPSYFLNPVENNSHLFDYEHWNETGGFQTSSNHPKISEKIFPKPSVSISDPNPLSVSGDFGDYFIFASHHLHGTSDNTQGYSRFSLEVRFVIGEHIKHHLGPKNIDNASSGTTLYEMKQLITGEIMPTDLIQSYVKESALS